jgi:hypothetical protein
MYQTLALKVLMEFLQKKTVAFNQANSESSFPFKHFSVLIGLSSINCFAACVLFEETPMHPKMTIIVCADVFLFSEHVVTESNGRETGLLSQFVAKYLSKYDDIRYYTLKSLWYSPLPRIVDWSINRCSRSVLSVLSLGTTVPCASRTGPRSSKPPSSRQIE